MPADAGGTAAPRLDLVHSSRFRARLRGPEGTARDTLLALADEVAAIPGVLRALVRPSTCSLIVETHEPVDTVLDRLSTRGVLRIAPPTTPPPLNQVLQLGLMRADMGVQSQTAGTLDLRTAIALALLAGAVFQLSRGRVAGPATTLAMSALSLLDKSGGFGGFSGFGSGGKKG